MLRFTVTYRWEIVLVGIPCIASVTGEFGVVSAAVLLGVSYVRVRRLERDLLRVAWGYVLASAIIAATAALVPEELRLGSLPASWVDLLDPPWFTPWLPFWPAMLAELLALLWFARQASRLGLAHAFFLAGFMFIPITHVVYTLFVNLDVSPLQPSPSSDIALFYATVTFAAAAIGASLLRAWLLGSFDQRGRAFRRNAAVHTDSGPVGVFHLGVGIGLPLAGFAAFYVVSPRVHVLLMLCTLVCWAAVLVLVYLVRVRQPAAGQQAQPGVRVQ